MDDSPKIETREKHSPFFSRIDWITFAVAFVISLAVYAHTLAPTVTLEDSGEMAVAADYLGIPHPPGYPLWTMIAWTFTEIFSFVKYLGQPNPAWAVAFSSSFFGALTAGLLAMLVSRVGRDHLLNFRSEGKSKLSPARAAMPPVCGIVAGLAAAFAPVQWSQSVIVEVYTMNAFLVVLQLLVAIVWVERPRDWLLYTLAGIFGISFTHYFYASAVNLSILMIAILFRDRRLFWDGLAAGLVLIALIFIFGKSGFQGHLVKTLSFTKQAFVCTFNPPEDLSETTAARYRWMMHGIGMLLIGAILVIIIHLKVPKDRKVEKFVAKSVVVLLFLLVASQLFAQCFKSAFEQTKQARIAAMQTGSFMNGIVLMAIPIIIAIVQKHFLPDLKKWITAPVIPLLFLLFFLLASGQFISAIAIPHPPTPNLYASLGITAKATALFRASALATLASLIWVILGEFFPNWKKLIIMGILVAAIWGGIYAYLPWASDRNPPMNWGYPRTMEGFKHAVFRGQYQKVVPSDVLSARFVKQAATYAMLLFRQFTLPIALLGFLPFCAWRIRAGKRRISAAAICLVLTVLILPIYIPARLAANFDAKPVPRLTSMLYDVPIFLIGVIAFAGIMAMFFGWLFKWMLSYKTKPGHLTYIAPSAFISALMLGLLKSVSIDHIRGFLATQNYEMMTPVAVYWSELRVHLASGLRLAAMLAFGCILLTAIILAMRTLIQELWKLRLKREHAIYVLVSLLPAFGLVILLCLSQPISASSMTEFLKHPVSKEHFLAKWIKTDDGGYNMVIGVFSVLIMHLVLWLYIFCASLISIRQWMAPDEDESLGLEWEIDARFRTWLVISFVSFLFWGLVFVCFANIGFHLQEIFIQRVKFLTSFSIYSMWIGYGLMIMADRIVPALTPKHATGTRVVSLCLIACLPVVPILNNAYNREIINDVGACDLDGHDFGWQFGNYELRGSEAIIEELLPTEEPLPNPMFPKEMGSDAVFYGGTDPGRFVPTYMIFSAQVRPDVFLITQNALADNTYMAVMRDLYGNDIWIPSAPDSARAFQRYVSEVKSGKRRPNAQINMEGGRVQVSGAGGVMEINGILAEEIFKHNKFRHDFYVEESYVILWMYPYLTPHGLIMKLNRNPVQLSKENVRNDTDFWDWYTRRLIGNEDFRRDVSARKSFSKLRGAIAGLYSHRGLISNAIDAYQQARLLYVLTPEANIRLIQEVYLRLRDWKRSKEVLAELISGDPENQGARDLLNRILAIEHAERRISEIEKSMPPTGIPLNTAFEMLELTRVAMLPQKYQRLAVALLSQTNLPWTEYNRAWDIFRKHGRMDLASRAVDLCLSKTPANIKPEIYLEMYKTYTSAKQGDKAISVMKKYLTAKPNDWKAWFELTMRYMEARKPNEAVATLERAIFYGGEMVFNMARQDRRLHPLLDAIKRYKQSTRSQKLPSPSTRPHPWGLNDDL